jgi:AcrR family transcriptional regulator
MTAANTSPQLTTKSAARMTAEDRRQQILDVAIRLFSQKGFRGTTTKEIALAAGVNEAIIFRHFATKRELYSAIIDQKACVAEVQMIDAEIEKAMSQHNDRKVFETIAFHILTKHDEDDTFLRLMFYSALEGHELSDLFFRNYVSERFRILAAYVKQRITAGSFRKVDPMTAVRMFFGTVLHHAIMNRFFNQSLGEQKLIISNRVAAERFADLFLAGIINHEPITDKRK